jgi:hypothetical protein
VVLRYAPKVGVEAKHKLAIKGRTEVVTEGMGATMRMEMTGTTFYSEKALSETPDRARMETLLTGGEFTIQMSGNTQTQEVPKGRIVADVDRQGRMLSLVESDFGGEAQSIMGTGTENWATFSNFSAFPEGNVAVGDSWSDELEIPAMPGGPKLSLKISSRLLGLATYEGRKCAKIRTTFKGPMSFTEEGEAEADSTSMEATLEGTMEWQYDYENSVYVDGEGSMGLDMKMSISAPEMPGTEVRTKMLANVTMTLLK